MKATVLNFFRENVVPLSLFAVIGTLYALTMPPTVTLEDSGHLILVGSTAGIAHPPGYPLFSLLGWLFSKLPFGSLAERFHLMSAMFGAVSIVLVYLISRRLSFPATPSIVAALILGVSTDFWWLSTIAEVYALNTFLCLLLLWMVLRGDHWQSPAFYCVLGLGLTNSWPLVILFAPVFLIAVKSERPKDWKLWAKCIGALFASLSLYLYLWVRSQFSNDFFTMGPVSGLKSFFGYIARRPYRFSDKAEYVGWAEFFDYLQFTIQIFINNIGWLGLFFILLGLTTIAQRKSQWRIGIALVYGIASSTIILWLFINLDFNVMKSENFVSFQGTSLAILALLISAGITFVTDRLPSLFWKFATASILAGFIFISVPVSTKDSLRQNDTFAKDYSELLLNALPKGATFFLHGDSDVGPLAYTHIADRIRPDVFLFSQRNFLLPFPGNSGAKIPGINASRKMRYLLENDGVFTLRPMPEFTRHFSQAKSFRLLDHKLFYEFTLGDSKWREPYDFMEKVKSFLLRNNTSTDYSKRWVYFREAMVAPLCRYLIKNGVREQKYFKSPSCWYYLARALSKENQLKRAKENIDLMARSTVHFPRSEKPPLYNLYLQISLAALRSSDYSAETLSMHSKEVLDVVFPVLIDYPKCKNALLPGFKKAALEFGHDQFYEPRMSVFSNCF